MSAQTGFVVPDGQYPPFATITPNDHAAWIIIPTALGLACSLFFCSIRVLVRTTISDASALDDYILYGATVLGAIQSSIVLGACSKGLGKAVDLLSPGAQDEVQRMYYTSNLFFIMVIALSKASVVRFLQRISQAEHHKLVLNILLGLIGAWAFASIMAIALQCNLHHPWFSIGEKCPGILARWQGICTLDIASEVAIVGLVFWVVYKLQMPKRRKAMVITIFSFRLINIIFIAFRLHTFSQNGYTTEPFLREARFIAWTQAEMNYSLISATIPTFQSFLKNMHTGFGGVGEAETENSYGSRYAKGSRIGTRKESVIGYRLSKLRSVKNSTLSESKEEVAMPAVPSSAEGKSLRAPNIFGVGQGHVSEVSNGDATSIASDGSGRMMIRKDVEYSIRPEDSKT